VKGALRPLVAANYRFRHRKAAKCGPDTSVVSFTFDDFPASAYRVGGRIVVDGGGAATFYASTGRESADPFTPAHLEQLLNDGHELGCHTHRHLRVGDVPLRVYEGDVLENTRALHSLVPGVALESFSYPYGSATLRSQHRVGRHFASSRGTLDGINRGSFDLNHLRGTRVYTGIDNLHALEEMIDDTAAEGGWLIFYTHDVVRSPSEFGCTPENLERLVARAAASNAQLLTVRAAVALMRPGMRLPKSGRRSAPSADR
jgi:peptidoglycan/xylan/chitin deacetylase (PgdA/CDA1 family)